MTSFHPTFALVAATAAAAAAIAIAPVVAAAPVGGGGSGGGVGVSRGAGRGGRRHQKAEDEPQRRMGQTGESRHADVARVGAAAPRGRRRPRRHGAGRRRLSNVAPTAGRRVIARRPACARLPSCPIHNDYVNCSLISSFSFTKLGLDSSPLAGL